ncbi:hypothetical protein PILCRDRAFT_823055 [Piloderma croceum F 1598]|uniref:Tautomerase cis-CaaD-like domain-containing protein n=1 Tax=Piloderma croceum (strain F 1598) TaxID=765440 RepID=A0A0C3B0V8_PILCF|nr:hypothetical protein PILCRDRAFT_823055 [Piloderma croceum F 1598]
MPLHRLYVPPNLYSAEDKAVIAEAITKVYAQLPAFYVVVLFIDIDKENYFVGGKRSERFVRIAVQHIARQFSDDPAKRNFMDRYEQALEPFTKGRGIDWEVQIEECDRILWNENGINPPLPNTEAENEWKMQNRAVPF